MSESSKTKTKRKAKGKKPEAKGHDGQLSCLNAAAKVLAEKGEPMTCKEMIEAMAAKGYWTTPGGKTPHATLIHPSRGRYATRERTLVSRSRNAANLPAPALGSRFRCPPAKRPRLAASRRRAV